MEPHDILAVTGKGVLGILGSTMAVIMPWQEQLEFWVRFSGAIFGCVVAILTIVSLVRGLLKR